MRVWLLSSSELGTKCDFCCSPGTILVPEEMTVRVAAWSCFLVFSSLAVNLPDNYYSDLGNGNLNVKFAHPEFHLAMSLD